MSNVQRPVAQLRVTDLVLDPLAQHEALCKALRGQALASAEADHIAALLPCAIAQLDAIGDDEGALALEALAARLLAVA
jgi:hypothetical protein